MGQKDRPVADRKVYRKNERPLINFFSPPLRPERLLRALAASRRSLRSEGLAQNTASYSDPATPTGDP